MDNVCSLYIMYNEILLTWEFYLFCVGGGWGVRQGYGALYTKKRLSLSKLSKQGTLIFMSLTALSAIFHSFQAVFQGKRIDECDTLPNYWLGC